MDLRRLEIFCRVVEFKSFTKAAEAVLLSQPAVSEQIRTLEESLGERLLDRLGREVLPTPAGQILYRYASRMLQLREEAMQKMALHKGGLSGQLILGASTIPGTYILPRIIGSFKARYPTVSLTLKISDTAEIIEGVWKGNLEVGVVGSRWKERGLTFEEIFSDALLLAVFPGHSWAGRPSIEMEDLYGEPFIMRERGSGTRMVMEQVLEKHGFDFARLPVVAEVGTTEAVRESVKAGIGISILSHRAVAEDLERCALFALPIEGIEFHRPFYLIQRANRQISPVCQVFLDHLRKKSQEEGHLTPFPKAREKD